MNPIVDGVAGNAIWAAIVRFVLLRGYATVRTFTKHSPFKSVVLCLRHRVHARTKYYEQAFASGTDVLYVSIMSQDTLKEMKPHLMTSQSTNTRIRVLTWHHDTPEGTVELFRKHLQENDEHRERTREQLCQATADWRTLEQAYTNLTVREYRSLPTMQGIIVHGKWALIGLMPYAAHKYERPALILTPQSDADAFKLIADQFEKLWNDSERQ